MKHDFDVIHEKMQNKPSQCELSDLGGCAGRLTLHRAVSYAGKRIQEPWAWLWICAKHHGVDEYQGYKVPERECRKRAMKKAPKEAMERYPRLDWRIVDED
jgi:hypothetical protein